VSNLKIWTTAVAEGDNHIAGSISDGAYLLMVLSPPPGLVLSYIFVAPVCLLLHPILPAAAWLCVGVPVSLLRGQFLLFHRARLLVVSVHVCICVRCASAYVVIRFT